MGQGLADGEENLVVVEFAFEQSVQDIDAGCRLGDGGQGRVEPLARAVVDERSRRLASLKHANHQSEYVSALCAPP